MFNIIMYDRCDFPSTYKKTSKRVKNFSDVCLRVTATYRVAGWQEPVELNEADRNTFTRNNKETKCKYNCLYVEHAFNFPVIDTTQIWMYTYECAVCSSYIFQNPSYKRHLSSRMRDMCGRGRRGGGGCIICNEYTFNLGALHTHTCMKFTYINIRMHCCYAEFCTRDICMWV